MEVSRNQTVSTIVETLLGAADEDELCSFTKALAVDWETAFTDRFASHVLQKLLWQIAPILYAEKLKDSDDGDETFPAAKK